MTGDVVRDRVASVCASSPFGFAQSATPFSFGLQPTGEIDQVFRIESQSRGIIGGFNYSEERTDALSIWLARKHYGAPEQAYRTLQQDASSLRAAVIRDGLQDGGDYGVPGDGAGVQITQDAGREFAMLRLTMPVNYEAEV